MNLCKQIEQAFAHRGKPNNVVERRDPVTPEQEDALNFQGRDWREISWQEWERNRDAFFAFTPDAFAYYLPSILSITSQEKAKWLTAADSFLRVLDRSPNIHHWDNFIVTRLIGLEISEFEAIKAWLLSLSGREPDFDEDLLTRAYETIDLLKLETEKVRNLIGR